MRYSRILIATAATLAFSLPAGAAEPAKPATPKAAPSKPAAASQAPVKQIHFRDLGGVKGWRAGEKDTIVYIQAADNSWYRVDMYETCMKFVNDKGLRFITEEDVTGELVSKVIANKYICTVLEMTKLDVPPPQAAK
jgi:hypothetical protein